MSFFYTNFVEIYIFLVQVGSIQEESQLLEQTPGGGGGALDFQMVGVCRWGVELTGPCLKPLGAREKYTLS